MSYNVAQIQNNLQQMEDLRARIVNLSKDIGTFHDGIHLREQIQDSVQELKKLSRSVREEIEEMKKNEGESSELSQIHAKFEALSSKIKEALTDVIASLRSTSASPQAGQLIESTPNQSDYSTSKNKRPLELITTPLLDQSMLDQETDEIYLLENSVNEILSSMRETNAIFTKTMQELQSQRNMIISTDTYTTKAAQNMKSGNEQLDKASSHQSGSRKALCVIFIIILVVAVGIGLYFLIQYLRKDKKKKED